MTSPVVAGSTSGTAASSATLTAALVMPGSVGATDLLVAALHIKGTQTSVTWPAGWVAINDFSISHALSIAYKFAAGTESGATVNVTHDVAGTAEYHVRRITGASHTVAPVTTILASSINPPSRAWTWGTADNLGIAVTMCGDNTSTLTAFPTNYTDSHLDNKNTGDATQHLMSGTRSFSGSSPEDPGAFSITGSGSTVNKTATTVVKPEAVATLTGSTQGATASVAAQNAFPYPNNAVASTAGSGTTGVCTLPANIVAGQRLVVCMALQNVGITAVAATGWTQRDCRVSAGASLTTAIMEKVASGSEGASVTFSYTGASAAADFIATSFDITHQSTALEFAVLDTSTGNSGSFDPPAVTPSWGADNTSWLVFVGSTTAVAPTGYPTGYTLSQINGTNCCQMVRQNNTATEDPASFFLTSGRHLGYTIAIPPVQPTNVAVVAGTTGRATASIILAQPEAAVVSGSTGHVTAALVGTNGEYLVASGTMGRATAAVAATNGEYAVLGATVAGVTASVVIAEAEQATIAGTLGEVTASVVVSLGDIAVVAGTMAAVTAALVIGQGDVLTLAGSLGAVTASIDIDDSAIDTNDAEISGSMGAVTAEVVIVEGPGLTLTGVLGPVTGSAAVVVRTALDLAGTLGQLSIDMAIAQGLRLTASGTLGRVTAAVVAANGLRASISGTARRVGFTGSVLITTPEFLIVAGSMRRVKSSMHVSMLSGIQRPTDPLAIIDMIGYDRTIDMPTVDRAITMPAVDRSAVMPAIDRTIVMSEGD